MTPGQRRVLEALAALEASYPLREGNTAHSVALRAWPDSHGWGMRSRRHATPAGGALGVGLNMLAGRMLAALERQALVRAVYRPHTAAQYAITSRGQEALR